MLNNKYFILIISFVYSTILTAQDTYTANSSGNWTSITWTCTDNGGGCDTTVPTSLDDVNTGGFEIIINGQFVIRNLLVDVNSSGIAIRFPSPATSITINGSLIGFDNSFGFANSPASSLFFGIGRLIFTGSNVTGLGAQGITNEIIAFWNSSSPLSRLELNLSGTSSVDFFFDPNTFADDFLLVSNSLIVNSGTLQTGSFQITDIAVATNLTISSSATLNSSVPVNGNGMDNSFISTVNISGTLDLSDNDSYLNSSTFNLNSGGTLDINFSGPNQMEGWWFNTNSPSTININNSSNSIYNANAAQNIFAASYGNLTLGASSSVTKALNGGDLTINGDFVVSGSNTTFNSNSDQVFIGGDVIMNGIWSPNGTVDFNGSSDQIISGANAISFNGVLRVSNTSGIVSLSNIGTDINLELDIDPSATFNPSDQTVNFSGDFRIDGNLSAGVSTFIIDGDTEFIGLGSGSRNFYNLEIANVLNAPSSGTFNVESNFENNGTFNPNGSTITFNGTEFGGQSISGSSTTEFNNIIVSNPETVFVNGTVGLNGFLTLAGSGSFDADGSGSGVFTIRSTDIINDARVAELPIPANFTGNVIVERFIAANTVTGGDFEYLSVPVNNASLNMWNDDFPITGNFSDANTSSDGCAGCSNITMSPSNSSVFFYDGSTSAFEALGDGGAIASNALLNGTGYSVYTFRDDAYTVDVTGDIGKGDQIISVVNGQFNLIGNPYPSAIDGDKIIDENSNFSTNIWIRTDNGVFAQYNTSLDMAIMPPNGSWAGEISMGQSFWVESTGATGLTINENDKTSASGIEFLDLEIPENVVRISLVGNEQSDETIIALRPEASLEFDREFDGVKFRNGELDSESGIRTHINLSSFTLSKDRNLSFNIIPLDMCEMTIDLGINDVPQGSYELEFSDLDGFATSHAISLHDSFLNEEFIIDNFFRYEFEVTADIMSYGDERFSIQFLDAGIDESDAPDLSIQQVCGEDSLVLRLDNTLSNILYSIEIQGTGIILEFNGSGSIIELPLEKSVLTSSSHDVNLFMSSLASCSADIILESIASIEIQELPDRVLVDDLKLCGTPEGTILINNFNDVFDYQLFRGEVFLAEFSSSSIDLDTITNSQNLTIKAVNNLGCSGPENSFQVTYVEEVIPSITQDGSLLISDIESNNQWYRNGTALQGETSDTLVVSQSGEYSVETTNNGCLFSSEIISFVISSQNEILTEGLNYIYPNPSDGEINVQSDTPIKSISLTNLNGEIIEPRKYDSKYHNSNYDLELNLGNLSSGVYLLTLYYSDGTVSNERIIKK